MYVNILAFPRFLFKFRYICLKHEYIKYESVSIMDVCLSVFPEEIICKNVSFVTLKS